MSFRCSRSPRAEDDHRARLRPPELGLASRVPPARATATVDGRAAVMCVFTACPPNSFRSAAMTLAPKESAWRERNRVSSDSVMTGAGTSRSIASCTVQRPSPESSTYPLSAARSASFANARSASSLSHERTTLPWFHTAAICLRSSLKSFDACRIS